MNAKHGRQVPSTILLRHLRAQLGTQSAGSCSMTRSCSCLNKPFASSQRHSLAGSRVPSTTNPFKAVYTNHDRQSSCTGFPTPNPGTLVSGRRFSTVGGLQESFWRRLRSSRPRPNQLRPNDLPPLHGFLDDNAGLGGRIIKPSSGLKLRCTEFDDNGNVTLVSGEFKKSELTSRYSLLPRDLRKIEGSVLPSILVRPSAILINLLHLRVLIKHNRVLVFDVYGTTNTYAQSLFMYDLEGKLRQKQTLAAAVAAGGIKDALPYEFRALEAVLISVTNLLESEFEGVREPVVRVLRELEEDIDRDKLRHLLIYSKKLGTFEQKARLVRDAIDDLLEADDDLASMYLTDKANGIEREQDNHDEVELLLESYHKVADEIVQVSSNLVSSIRNTEEIVKAILDANRNSLMLLDLKFSIGTLGIGAGTFIAALYGMNLKNFIEESDAGFWGVSAVCSVVSVVFVVWGFRKLRKIQRLRMWGEGGSAGGGISDGGVGRGRGGRGSWREIEGRKGAGRADERGRPGEEVEGIASAEASAAKRREQKYGANASTAESLEVKPT